MLTLGPESIQKVIAAINGEDFSVEDDTDAIDWDTLDPVARLTAPETEQQTVTAEPFTFDQRVATLTPKEKVVAQKTFEQQSPGSPAAFRAAEESHKPIALTTGNFVRKLLAEEGQEYEWGGTTRKTGFDCSGLLWRKMTKLGIGGFPRTSGEIYAHSRHISVAKAIKTRGAILWHEGHIAVSLGNGKTIEAMGEDYGVVIGEAHGRFTGGGLLPELKLGKALQEASKSRLPRMRTRTVARGDGITANSLISAPTVFGSILGEVQGPSPRTKEEWDTHSATGGLGFVPARYRGIIKDAANEAGISARLLAYVAQHESNFNPKAVSSAGAQGLLQIMPLHNLAQPFNARANAFFGARLLAGYIAQMGSLRLGLAAYNAGPGNVEAGLDYADSILDDFLGRRTA